MKPGFEWDEEKATTNLKKHGIDFSEAVTVFLDPFSLTVADPDHSVKESRYIDSGTSEKGRVLIVVYTERGANIRIISCRPAVPAERRTV
jgi:hypothetical protein